MRTFILVLVILLVQDAWAQSPENFTANHLVELQRISDPQASPDGRHVAFVVRRTDREADKGRTSIWLMDIDGGNARQLTPDSSAHFQPRWSADGRYLFFISSRSGSTQVWRLPMAGGEATQVTDYPLSVNAYAVTPDGLRAIVSMDVFRDCDSLSCTQERLDEEAEDQVTGMEYSELFIRHWDTWNDHRNAVLFATNLDPATGAAVGDPQPLTGSMASNVPSRPFGGPEDFTVSADGSTVYFAARTAQGSDRTWKTNFDIFSVASSGSGEIQNLTADNQAWDAQPTVSPDGSRLAYVAMKRPGFEADRFHIVVMDLASGEKRAITDDWDRSVSSLAWSADGRSLFVSAQHIGNKPLWRLDAESGEVKELVAKGTIGGFSVTPNHVVVARSDLRSPAELYRVNTDGEGLVKLSGLNDEAMSALRTGEFEQFSFSGWNDETVYGYVVKPAGFERGEKYPLAFLIHGGPQGSFSNNFHYRWNPQTYAGQEFAVVMIDFHGSTGYGQAFTDSISGDWGGKPLVDLQKGLDAALEKYDWIDGERVCALGASYGGYMINWIAGNWPDRFRCLVNHDGVFDNRMMYYSTEELWFPEWEHGGPHFENPEGFEKHNPVNHVDQWRTPMLVIHGALDFRVPYTQGIAAFTALQRKGIESELLFFPDENHWVLKPANSVMWHDSVNRWLHKWLSD